MIVIDGSSGEGGGQVLRTSLGLSLVTGKPFRIEKIRAGRSKPGLLRQHLTAVHAATEIGRASVEGDVLGSQTLTFIPGELRCGDYSFSIGSAGSTTLVLQTVLPALMTMRELCTVTVQGGTHNSSAPPFDFFAKAFLPQVRRMGVDIEIELIRPGFYPAGGGKLCLSVSGAARFVPLGLEARGAIVSRRAQQPLRICRSVSRGGKSR